MVCMMVAFLLLASVDFVVDMLSKRLESRLASDDFLVCDVAIIFASFEGTNGKIVEYPK